MIYLLKMSYDWSFCRDLMVNASSVAYISRSAMFLTSLQIIALPLKVTNPTVAGRLILSWKILRYLLLSAASAIDWVIDLVYLFVLGLFYISFSFSVFYVVCFWWSCYLKSAETLKAFPSKI